MAVRSPRAEGEQTVGDRNLVYSFGGARQDKSWALSGADTRRVALLCPRRGARGAVPAARRREGRPGSPRPGPTRLDACFFRESAADCGFC